MIVYSVQSDLLRSITLLRSYVIGSLSGRLFHKLNNMMCVAITNLDVIATEQRKGEVEEEVILETRQALETYNSLVESFTYLFKTDRVEGKGCALSRCLDKVSVLIEAKVITDVRIAVKEGNTTYCTLDCCMGILFVILSLVQSMQDGNAGKEQIEVEVRCSQDQAVIQISSALVKNIPEYLVKKPVKDDSAIFGIEWFLVTELLNAMKARVVRGEGLKEKNRLFIEIPLEKLGDGSKT